MYKYQRGEVYLISEQQNQGHEIQKTRPWVLVGTNPINRARSTVIAIPLSTQLKLKPPIAIEVYLNNTMLRAIIDQIRALDKKRIIRLEGELSQHEQNQIDDALRIVLSL